MKPERRRRPGELVRVMTQRTQILRTLTIAERSSRAVGNVLHPARQLGDERLGELPQPSLYTVRERGQMFTSRRQPPVLESGGTANQRR